MKLSMNVLKSAVLATLVSFAGHASAIGSAASPVSLGLLGDADTTFGNTLKSTTGGFTDYYSFSIGGSSTGAAGSTVETAWNFWVSGVDITTIKLTGGTLSSALIDTNASNGFLFTGMGAGTYTMALSGNVTWGLTSGAYTGTIHAISSSAPSAPVASPAPEPADFAMALMGLAGVGFMVRRRAAR